MEFEVGRSTGVCAVSGRELAEGETYYAVLFTDGGTFRRVDYSEDSWTEPPQDAFCHFKTRVPIRERKQPLLVDNEMLVQFFLRLASETEPARLQFRFVLALILMRKRLLRYEQTKHEQGTECWQMRLMKEQSLHQVVNPHLTDEQIDDVSRQLSAILNGNFDDAIVHSESDGSQAVSADETSDA